MVDEYWTNSASAEELREYFEFWKGLSPEERENIIWYSVSVLDELGSDFNRRQDSYFKLQEGLEQKIKRFGLGGYNRMPLLEIENNPELWHTNARNKGEALQIARNQYVFAVKVGFEGMVEHITTGHNKSARSRDETKEISEKMATLYRDISKLETAMEEWLAERPVAINMPR